MRLVQILPFEESFFPSNSNSLSNQPLYSCWGEAPTHSRNVVESDTNVKFDGPSPFKHHGSDTLHHKGGNAGYDAVVSPRVLESDDDCEHPFIDFATGDELCTYQEIFARRLSKACCLTRCI